MKEEGGEKGKRKDRGEAIVCSEIIRSIVSISLGRYEGPGLLSVREKGRGKKEKFRAAGEGKTTKSSLCDHPPSL